MAKAGQQGRGREMKIHARMSPKGTPRLTKKQLLFSESKVKETVWSPFAHERNSVRFWASNFSAPSVDVRLFL
jgi:hypothetical protein